MSRSCLPVHVLVLFLLLCRCQESLGSLSGVDDEESRPLSTFPRRGVEALRIIYELSGLVQQPRLSELTNLVGKADTRAFCRRLPDQLTPYGIEGLLGPFHSRKQKASISQCRFHIYEAYGVMGVLYGTEFEE